MKAIATRLLFLLAVCAFLVPLSYANDSQVYDAGQNVYPINNDNIRMVSEKVTIARKKVPWMYQDKMYMVDGASVDCEFLFENMTDEVMTVKIGFPGIACEFPEPFCNPGLINFVSYIDGKEVPVTVKKEVTDVYGYYGKNQDKEQVLPDYYFKRTWYTWDVKFTPRSKLRLRNTYDTKLSNDSLGYSWYEYILITGANWNGPIGSAIIEVSYDNANTMKRIVSRIEPGGYEIKGNKIIWNFKNLTPKENIRILELSNGIMDYYALDFVSHFNSKQYEGAERLYARDDMVNSIKPDKALSEVQSLYPLISRDILSEYLERQFVRLLRNEIFARHGRVFQTNEMQMIFENADYGMPWYHRNRNYSDDLLNEIEKKNVQFILNYEKERGWR